MTPVPISVDGRVYGYVYHSSARRRWCLDCLSARRLLTLIDLLRSGWPASAGSTGGRLDVDVVLDLVEEGRVTFGEIPIRFPGEVAR